MDEKAISNYLFAVGANQMRRKLRQGIGRGIRRPNDSVKLWLLDPRFPLPATLSDPLDASTGITINPFFNSLVNRSEEHTSELQSLMRKSYAVFCLKKQKKRYTSTQVH